MYVNCDDCWKYWKIACPECAEEKAQKHRDATGHEVKVIGVDETRGTPPSDYVPNIRDFPDWMRGSKRG